MPVSKKAVLKRLNILRFIQSRKEPVLTSDVASLIKDTTHGAFYELSVLKQKGWVNKRKHKGTFLLDGKPHLTPYCSWELTAKGEEILSLSSSGDI